MRLRSEAAAWWGSKKYVLLYDEKSLENFQACNVDKNELFQGIHSWSKISDPYFPEFGLNTEIKSPYSVQIQQNTDQK